MNKKGGQEGLCQRIPPAPVGSGPGSPPWDVLVTSVWVGSHTQQKEEIGALRPFCNHCRMCSQDEEPTDSSNPMWALLRCPEPRLPPGTVEGSPVPSSSWLRLPWDRKEPLSFAKNSAIV